MAIVRNPATHYPFKKPFFKDGCVVKRNNRTLVEGVDYYFGHLYVKGTIRHAKTAYGSIWLYNKVDLNGLTVTAEQLPHGEATQAQIDAEIVENGSVIAPVRFWDDILKEHYYPPINIQFDEENWRGELELMLAIKSVGDTLSAKPATDDDVYELAKIWLTSLENIFARSPCHQHVLNTRNPHREEYNWIGALVRDGYAANAAKLYNFTLAELTTYVNERSAKQADLNSKLLKVGRKVINSEMRFKNGVGFIVSKDAGLSVNNKVGALYGKGNVKITSNENRAITLSGGANSLVLYPDARGLHFNGQPVLTKTNIGPHIPKPGGVSFEYMFKTENNLSMVGKGSTDNPVDLTWVRQPSEPDLLNVTKARGNSKTIAGHVDLLKAYHNVFNGKLTIGKANINGVVIEANTLLSKGVFGLSFVENLSDLELPLSKSQQDLLRGYSDINHTHSPFEFGIVDATDKVVGKVRYRPHSSMEGYENVASGPYDIANQYHAIDVIDIEEQAKSSVSLLPSAALKMIRYGESGKGLVDSTISGNRLRITKKVPYYVEKHYEAPITEINLDEVFNGTVGKGYVYVTLDIATGKVSYVATISETVETDTTTLAGVVYRNADGSYRAVLRHRTRLGNFLELTEHMDNPTAHTGLVLDKNNVGLGSLPNLEASAVMTKPTFAEVFNSWHRFSHGAFFNGVPGQHANGGTAQPANVAALTGWTYDGVNDTVVMPYNVGSFCGFVSPDKYGDYVFDTVLSSNATDDDQIGVLIGFHVDDSGVEHTLSLIASNAGAATNLLLADNYLQTGGAARQHQNLFASIHPAKEPVKNWNVIGEKRLRVERKGNRFVVDHFEFSMWANGNRDKLVETIVFWLDSAKFHHVIYPDSGSPTVTTKTNQMIADRGVKYRTRSNFGYVTFSQPNATFKNLMRPDEDSRNYLATLPALLDNVSYFSKTRTFVETTPLTRNGFNHITALPNGIGINTYAGVVNVPWNQYMYDQPAPFNGLSTKRVGIVNMSKDVFKPISSLFEDASASDNFQRPFDIETLTGL